MRCFPEQLVEMHSYESYLDYFNRLYCIFQNEILNKLYINDKPVKVREFPPEGLDREEAFYHLTCTDYSGKLDYRYPDFHRSKRIKLIKPIVENFQECPSCEQSDCHSILLWEKTVKRKTRLHLYLEEMDYIVVLEERNNYYLLITAFYVYPQQKEHFFEENDKYAI